MTTCSSHCPETLHAAPDLMSPPSCSEGWMHPSIIRPYYPLKIINTNFRLGLSSLTKCRFISGVLNIKMQLILFLISGSALRGSECQPPINLHLLYPLTVLWDGWEHVRLTEPPKVPALQGIWHRNHFVVSPTYYRREMFLLHCEWLVLWMVLWYR